MLVLWPLFSTQLVRAEEHATGTFPQLNFWGNTNSDSLQMHHEFDRQVGYGLSQSWLLLFFLLISYMK